MLTTEYHGIRNELGSRRLFSLLLHFYSLGKVGFLAPQNALKSDGRSNQHQ
jgi:hypothetical protein